MRTRSLQAPQSSDHGLRVLGLIGFVFEELEQESDHDPPFGIIDRVRRVDCLVRRPQPIPERNPGFGGHDLYFADEVVGQPALARRCPYSWRNPPWWSRRWMFR